MILFGHEVAMKTVPCAYNGKPDKNPGDDYVNLYVRLTNKCQASCEFCEFRCNEDKTKFDFYKFHYIIHELNKRLRINKISFTGGEPTLESQMLNQCLMSVKEINPKIFTVVNSNGLNLNHVNFEVLDSYALSRHAIGDENQTVFKTGNIKTDAALAKLEESTKKKIHISCNLDKNHVGTPARMYEFINHYSKLGFHDFGFVTLMEVNDYCRENKVDFQKLKLDTMKNTRRVCTFNDGDSCFCANYVTFDDEGDLNRWYARHYCDSTKAASTLVYDLNYLKVGFNGKTILE